MIQVLWECNDKVQFQNKSIKQNKFLIVSVCRINSVNGSQISVKNKYQKNQKAIQTSYIFTHKTTKKKLFKRVYYYLQNTKVI